MFHVCEEVKYRKLWEIGGKREGEPRSLLNSGEELFGLTFDEHLP